MSEHITVEDAGPVRTVRMNRPDKKNALTASMYAAMADALENANGHAEIRCVVIAGAPGAFSAGNDLQEFLQAATTGEGLGTSVVRFLHALARSERPLVAAVQGVAVGVGTTMLLHCDHVVAGTDARFSTPFITLGLVPEAASTLLAATADGTPARLRAFGHGPAARRRGGPGLRPGQRGRAAGRRRRPALKAAREIAALPAEAVAAARRLMRGSPDETVARIDEEVRLFKQRLQSAEAQAAFGAFLTRKR